jgi:hypothetical protein
MNIKREQVVSMINNLKNGSIYSVKFIKKSGEERLMNSIKGTSKGVNGTGKKFSDEEKGLLSVFDMQLRSKGVEESKCWRSINLSTILEFTCNKEKYVVVD